MRSKLPPLQNMALRLMALIAALCSLCTASAWAQADTVTKNSVDGVQIAKITPRVLSDLPVPIRFTYTLDLKVLLRSTDKGTVQVRFERTSVGNPQRVAVAPPVEKAVTRGQGVHLLLESAPISIERALPGERLVVTASLRDAKGHEVSYSSSYNRLSGTMKLRPSAAVPTADKVEILGTTPNASSTITVGANTWFTVRIFYSVKSAQTAYASVEFGDLSEVKRGACWFSTTVPLPRGCGTAEIKVPHFFPSFTAGQSMAIAVPLRIKPLDPSIMLVEVHPFSLEAKP